MKIASPMATAPRSLAFTPLTRLGRGVREALARRRVRREIRDLSRLSDHQLWDIGLRDYAPRRDPTPPYFWR